MSLSAETPYQSYPPSLYRQPGPIDPAITSLVPATGVVGVEVTVRVLGARFDAAAVVEVDQVAAPTVFVSATELTATVTPASAGVKSVTVRNGNDEESNGVNFTVTVADDPEGNPAAIDPGAQPKAPKG